MNYRRIVPNSISGLSLVLGILSICKSIDQDFFWAPVFIVLAVVADSLDGRAARLLHCQGEFGVQLDSLCDLASFGVAPSVMIYQYALTELGVAGQIVAALYCFGGAMRLARFNVNASVVHGYFQGMPIPAGACCLAAYVISGYNFGVAGSGIMTLLVGIILYSTVKYPDCKGKGNLISPLALPPFLLAVAAGAYLLWLRPAGWPFVLMAVYTLAGVFNFVWEGLHK